LKQLGPRYYYSTRLSLLSLYIDIEFHLSNKFHLFLLFFILSTVITTFFTIVSVQLLCTKRWLIFWFSKNRMMSKHWYSSLKQKYDLFKSWDILSAQLNVFHSTLNRFWKNIWRLKAQYWKLKIVIGEEKVVNKADKKSFEKHFS